MLLVRRIADGLQELLIAAESADILRRAGIVRISANVTVDFGSVTGLRSGAGLRGEDCRKGLFLTGLAIS